MTLSLALDTTEKRIAALVRSGAQKPHGTRSRYVAGKCRCELCRRANTDYRKLRDRQLGRGKTNSLTPAEPVRIHILMLSRQGVGYKTVADASGVSQSVIARIVWGPRRQVRRSTAASILAVDTSCMPDSALVPAGATWLLLDRLIDNGYTKTQLAAWLGLQTPCLQLCRDRVTALNASKVARMVQLIDEGRLERSK
jgi:hypothetical protein